MTGPAFVQPECRLRVPIFRHRFKSRNKFRRFEPEIGVAINAREDGILSNSEPWAPMFKRSFATSCLLSQALTPGRRIWGVACAAIAPRSLTRSRPVAQGAGANGKPTPPQASARILVLVRVLSTCADHVFGDVCVLLLVSPRRPNEGCEVQRRHEVAVGRLGPRA